jgi:heat-inducible transcriptional repressor
MTLQLARREVDEALRLTSETLAQVTDLMSIVSAPPIETTTIRHIEVLLLQPQVLMVVIITSTGGVSKRVFTYERPVDPGLADWSASYLNEALVGKGLGARTLRSRLTDPTLPPTERSFSRGSRRRSRTSPRPRATRSTSRGRRGCSPSTASRTSPSSTSCSSCSSAASRCWACSRRPSTSATSTCASAARTRRPRCAGCRWWRPNYGLPQRNLGTVSVIGPTRMDYATAIGAVRTAALQLSRFVEDVYDAD